MAKPSYSENRYLNEITVLRAVACLSVVMLHSIKNIVSFVEGSPLTENVLLTISGMLSFGTPTFILISIILLAYSYKGRELPYDFYTKRTQYIVFPFLFMAVLFAVMVNHQNIGDIPKGILLNILGGYHGWFVLLIFQFYILYHLFSKYMDKHKPIKVLTFCLVVNAAYLFVFTVLPPPTDSAFVLYMWDRGFWVPFFGWFFYFAVAFYIGRNYREFILKIQKHRLLIVFALLISTAIVLFNNQFFEYGSKRIDMIFFTTSLIFLLLSFLANVKKVNPMIKMISEYSFGIYLLHFFYIVIFKQIALILGIEIGYWGILIWFVGAVCCSIITIKIANAFPFGKYTVGRINTAKQNKSLSN